MPTYSIIRTRKQVVAGQMIAFGLVVALISSWGAFIITMNDLAECRATVKASTPVDTQRMVCETKPDENGKFNCKEEEVEY